MGVGFLWEQVRAYVCGCSLRSEMVRETGGREERAGAVATGNWRARGGGGGSIDKGRSGSEMSL